MNRPSESSEESGFNPWPYALSAFLGLFAACVIGFGIWAVRQKIDLVGADYYEQEVRYQKQIDRQARTLAMGEPVAIAYSRDSNRISIALPATHAQSSPTGQIRFYRPSDASLDRTLPLAVDATGRQELDASALLNGRWKVRVDWTSAGADYTAEENLDVGRKAAL